MKMDQKIEMKEQRKKKIIKKKKYEILFSIIYLFIN